LEVNVTKSRGIRGGTASGVESASLRHLDTRFKVSGNGRGLEGSSGKVLRESSSRLEGLDGSLRARVSRKETSGSNGGHIRASGRERGVEGAVAALILESSNNFTSSSAVTAGKDDRQSTGTELLEFSVEASSVGVRRIVSLGSIGNRVDERGVGLIVELSSPGHQIIPEVEALQGVEVGGNVGCNSHNVLNIETGLNSGAGGDVLSHNFGDGLEGGEGNIGIPELLEVRWRVVLSLELSNGVQVVGVGSNEGAGDVVTGTDNGGGDIEASIRGRVNSQGGLIHLGKANGSGHNVHNISNGSGQRVGADGGIEGASVKVSVGVELDVEDLGGEAH
jgi:hypothetical protein